MADVYGVVPADIAAELPGMFPVGFTQVTKPSLAQVTSLITSADLSVAVAVENASGTAPEASDRLAPLARRVVIDLVKAQVVRIVYAGNAPASVNDAAGPYETAAEATLRAITTLQTQATGAGEPVNRVLSSSTTPCRDLLVCDSDLGPAPHRGGYGYGDRGRY